MTPTGCAATQQCAEGSLGQMMRQATTAEVRLDAGKAALFNVSAQSTTASCPARSVICR